MSSAPRMLAAPPMCRSISAAASISATGFARFCPAMSSAVPPMVSNIDTALGLLGLVLFELTSPTPPVTFAAMSEPMSPNMLVVTTTSNRSGCAAMAARPSSMIRKFASIPRSPRRSRR